MSRRIYTILAFILAVLLTVIGWSQTLVYEECPVNKLALWFPSIEIFNPSDDIHTVFISLIQFPILATLFALGIRRWRVASVLLVLVLVYALLVRIALTIIDCELSGFNTH